MGACYCTGTCRQNGGYCPNTHTTPPAPLPVWPPGQTRAIPAPLTADDVRRIIREELDRGVK